ncbi:MAG TPA: chromosomal replication initiator protein DnaA, partial [Candidatus Cloacimonas sp.]|nr:chromosomal replication initiator protein DnaA [Candidatus Cloacimonas sp.]
MHDYNEIWRNVLETLQQNISEQGFNTWFTETQLINIQDNELQIKVPSKFIAEYLNHN